MHTKCNLKLDKKRQCVRCIEDMWSSHSRREWWLVQGTHRKALPTKGSETQDLSILCQTNLYLYSLYVSIYICVFYFTFLHFNPLWRDEWYSICLAFTELQVLLPTPEKANKLTNISWKPSSLYLKDILSLVTAK